ncbi:hypothetical protein [Rhodococcoides fascians]|uniref:hypothetical protein n=1 Tax=Rhodococcoides fascians TaxID=1828 RepID=UPI00055D19DC|nr:hypothetical protein [Rhodococcus fascians]
MIPTVTQQLQALRRRVSETLMPALPETAKFANEQAKLVVSTIDFLIDTHEHEYRYEVLENIEYRQLVASLTAHKADASAEEILGERGPAPSDAAIKLERIVDQNRRLKDTARRLDAEASVNPESDSAVQANSLVAELAQRQVARELSWYRLSGFPDSPGEIGATLYPANSFDSPVADLAP